MGLAGALSNTELAARLQCLTARDWHQVRRPRGQAGWSDGRRKFGNVRDAIVEVMSAADSELPRRLSVGPLAVLRASSTARTQPRLKPDAHEHSGGDREHKDAAGSDLGGGRARAGLRDAPAD